MHPELTPVFYKIQPSSQLLEADLNIYSREFFSISQLVLVTGVGWAVAMWPSWVCQEFPYPYEYKCIYVYVHVCMHVIKHKHTHKFPQDTPVYKLSEVQRRCDDTTVHNANTRIYPHQPLSDGHYVLIALAINTPQ